MNSALRKYKKGKIIKKTCKMYIDILYYFHLLKIFFFFIGLKIQRQDNSYNSCDKNISIKITLSVFFYQDVG